MYKEYNKIKSFMDHANDLFDTSMKMEDIFHRSTITHPRSRAVEFFADNGKVRHYNYSKFRKHCYEFASVISSFLIQQPKNRPLVLKLANCPRWGEIFWGILMSGYKPLLIDAKTSREGTQNLIDQSKAIAIITNDDYEYSINKFTLNDLVNENKHYSFAPTWENEVIFCSSGTTGDAKLMVFNGENLVHQIAASLDMAKTTKDIMYPKKFGKIKILAMIPFHHIFGFVAVFLWYTFYGKTLVYPNSLAPTEIQNICQSRKITHVYSVPLFWDSLVTAFERKQALETPQKQVILDKMIGYHTHKLSKEDAGSGSYPIVLNKVQKQILGSRIRYCISGGGYLSSKTSMIINGLGYPLYNGYGMTELGVTSVELSPYVEQRLKCSIGKPLYGIEYKIKNIDKKTHQGELYIKSNITHIREIIGGNEKDTEFDNEGYYPTGDIAEVDSINNYYIKGRIKDIIINSNGENVFPDELEIFFRKINNINNLCVLGIKKGNSTNEKIVLALEVNNKVTVEDITTLKNDIQIVGQNLPKGTKIDEVYLCRKKLPLANNMKVKRYLVKKGIESNSQDYQPIDGKRKTKTFKGFDEETIKKIVVPMRRLFSNVLILPEFKIDDDAHWINDLGGDSMNYVELCQKVQEHYHVVIPEEKYGQLTCVNDFVEEVANLQKGKTAKK